MRFAPIVILSGAGISRESGLDTFRDKGGIWDKYDPQKVATLEGWHNNPELVQEFYNRRRSELLNDNIQPNAAHLALAKLQQCWQAPCTIVTQNIDDLHERACQSLVEKDKEKEKGKDKVARSSRDSIGNIVHIHGETLRSLCSLCSARARCEEDLSVRSVCKACGATGSLRPDVVWFGEVPYRLPLVYKLLEACRLFVAVGTAGSVYPAAGFVSNAQAARTLEVNIARTEISPLFQEHRYGKASQEIPKLVEEILAEKSHEAS